MGRIDALRDIANDGGLREEILSRISDDPHLAERALSEAAGPQPELEALDGGARVTADRARAVIDDPPAIPEDLQTEAIVLLLGRPVLLVRNDDVDLATLETDTWRQRLEDARAVVRTAIPSVGRVELRNHPRLDWVGTGWLVADDVIVTNRHVAEVFARSTAAGFTFRPPATLEARIDFNEERDAVTPAEIRVAEVLHIEDDRGPDLAFLRVEWNGAVDPSGRRPIPLAATIDEGRDIAVIGYPAKDSRTRIPGEMDRIFGEIYNVKRLAPGRLTRRADERGHANHDCTTLGGNSGSAVIDLESGDAVALHFAGRERDRNFAVPAPVVQAALGRLRPAAAVTPRPPEPAVVPVTEGDRSGYDPAFLGPTVDHPELTCGLADAVAPVVGTDDGILRYTHYSVRMHRFRRLAMYVAVNIDGRALRRVPRGRDGWKLDPRLDPQFQADNALYRHNNLDRGHLVRRLDPAWGDTFDDARAGARDTFFYTNCAPQHQLHNQRLWLGLEDHILDSAAAHELRASVFTGPIFRHDDRTYRGILLPEDFWKVVAIVNSGTGQLSVTGYVVSQRDFMHDLEFVFGPYETYQVPVETIESETGLRFGLTEFDPLGAAEGLAVRHLRTAADIVL